MSAIKYMVGSFACDETVRLFRLEKVRTFPPDIQHITMRLSCYFQWPAEVWLNLQPTMTAK